MKSALFLAAFLFCYFLLLFVAILQFGFQGFIIVTQTSLIAILANDTYDDLQEELRKKKDQEEG